MLTPSKHRHTASGEMKQAFSEAEQQSNKIQARKLETIVIALQAVAFSKPNIEILPQHAAS